VQNSLHCYDVETGKFLWRLGDIFRGGDNFAETHFLGAPLSLEGKAYVLNEKNTGEIRLITVDAKQGTLRNTLDLVKVGSQSRYLVDLRRRLNPVHLAAADGILVCSTYAGAILGIDLAVPKIVWMYRYRE